MIHRNVDKMAAAEAALTYVPEKAVVGVGTGSTVNYFIEALAGIKSRIQGAVASSRESHAKLTRLGIRVLDLNSVHDIPVYVDSADEINRQLVMIKGAGGALTGEKIVAAVASRFICIADAGKLVEILGSVPLPIEVIPLAREYVARKIENLGGRPELRIGFTTDYGNVILDVRELMVPDPREMEATLNQIPGVVSNGLFARRSADLLLLGTEGHVRPMTPQYGAVNDADV